MQSAVLERKPTLKPNGRWVFVPDPDEGEPMTFQVGIVGSDGILLASDTQYTSDGIRHSTNSPKIHIDGGVAWCCSGATVAELFGQSYSRRFQLDCDDIGGLMSECRDNLLADYDDTLWPGHRGTVLTVQRSGVDVQLWRIEIHTSQGAQLPPMRIYTQKWEGDESNPAVFFQRYMQGQKHPLDRLKSVAGHAVNMASKFSSGVSGLEIVECRSTGFTRVSDREIQTLLQSSDDLDEAIRLRLFPLAGV